VDHGWTLNLPDWARLKSVLGTGLAWEVVELSDLHQSMVPERSGVYVITASPPGYSAGGSKKANRLMAHLLCPVYIGRSESNIRTRFNSHCKSPSDLVRAAKKCYAGTLRFWFAQLNADEVVAVETHLISCFKPPANAKLGDPVKEGPPIKGTLGVPQPA
jgi:hypothetical protein